MKTLAEKLLRLLVNQDLRETVIEKYKPKMTSELRDAALEMAAYFLTQPEYDTKKSDLHQLIADIIGHGPAPRL